MSATAKAAARLAHRAPAQRRGQATLDRIVAATERLLKSKPFEEITIADIVGEAETSTGSFYARFGSKEALLPFLYENYNSLADQAWDDVAARGDVAGGSLREAVHALMNVIRSGPLALNNYIRAMALYARAHPERLPASAMARSKRFYQMIAQRLTPHIATSTRQADKRARFAAFAAMTLMREHQLFGGAPLAKALGMSADAFASEVEAMTTAYLAASNNK